MITALPRRAHVHQHALRAPEPLAHGERGRHAVESRQMPTVRRTFPPTRVSLVAGLTDADGEVRTLSADVLARGYWGPVVALLSLRWHLDHADAEDLAQEFFAAAFEKQWFSRYAPERGRFRTFLRTLLDRFAADAVRARHRLKRGGGLTAESLDAADLQAPDTPDETDARVHAEWVRSVLALALDALREEGANTGRTVQVQLFEAYDVADVPDAERPTYRALAQRFGIPDTQVTNYLTWARRAYRRQVLAALRTLAGNEVEFRDDVRSLLGGRSAAP